jgi:hypothetical protein
MVMAKRLGKMGKLGTLETFIRARNTGRESLSGMMDPITMESFRMDILRAMISVFSNIIGTYVFADIGKVYVESLERAIWREEAQRIGKMVGSMMGTIN